jgi:hypothetical protein
MRVLLVMLLIGYRLAEIHTHKGVSWVDITRKNVVPARHKTQHR